MKEISKFDLLNSKLSGSNLIEASAGTGKTYNLVFIYLRLLLEKNLDVEDILVTTFTNAAAAELKERIYNKISETELILTSFIEGKNIDNTNYDSNLLEFCIKFKNSPKTILKKVKLAKSNFSYAQIVTIDSFCLHLLKSNYISIATYDISEQEVVSNYRDIIKKIYIDLAKNSFKSISEVNEEVCYILNEKNINDLSKVLTEVVSKLPYLKKSIKYIEQNIINFNNTIDILKTAIYEQKQLIIDEINIAIKGGQKGRVYTEKKTINNLEEVDKLLNNYCESNYLTNAIESYFSKSKMTEKLNFFSSNLSFFEIFNTFLEQKKSIPKEKDYLLNKAYISIGTKIYDELTKYKSESQIISYEDITKIIYEASLLGLSTKIKAALIDETQDCSYQQTDIFTNLFISQKKTCFFIGDPKQSIYGFRGSDVFAYMAIKSRVDNNYVLYTNYRSSRFLNTSINKIFDKDNTFLSENIIYCPVKSSSTIKSKLDNDEFSLEYCKINKYKTEDIADQCAKQVLHFLSSNYNISIADDKRKVLPKDIAILVSSNNQGELIKKSLAKLGLSSAFLSKRDIFRTNSAYCFFWLLKAISEPTITNINTILISPLYGYSFKDIESDKNLGIALVNRFTKYQNLYTYNGFSYTLWKILSKEKILGNMLESSYGKRLVTNFLHIFEVVLEKTKQNSISIFALCYLVEQEILDKEIYNQVENEPRLDDEYAITIQTIHKAKGLEYPIVFHPFIDYKEKTIYKNIIISNSLHKASFFSDNIEEIKKVVALEEQQEKIRVAYVALTRAKFKNIIFITSDETQYPSRSKNPNFRVGSLWQRLVNYSDFTNIFNNTFAIDKTNFILNKKYNKKYVSKEIPKTFTKELSSSWYLESFSSLSKSTSNITTNIEIPYSSDINLPINNTLINFKKGPIAGNSIHEIFEKFMGNREKIKVYTRESLLNHFPESNFSDNYISNLSDDLLLVIKTKLYPNTFSLSDISLDKQSIEMEFFMHLNKDARNYILSLFTNSYKVDIESYLHGFIDLVFCYNNKYYIVDYKTNFLGKTYPDYNQSKMSEAMSEHNYELQAYIYTVALCRHLKNILPNFSYQKHIGGYYYLFIRGINPNLLEDSENKSTGIYFKKINWEIIKGAY